MDALKAVFGDRREPITDQTTAEDVSGWDSFSHVQLIFEIERRLGCRVDIGKTYDVENVGALIRFIEMV